MKIAWIGLTGTLGTAFITATITLYVHMTPDEKANAKNSSSTTSKKVASEHGNTIIQIECPTYQKLDTATQQDVQRTVDVLDEKLEAEDLQLQRRAHQVTQLTEAVSVLETQKDKPGAPHGADRALDQLKQGDTEEAEAFFQTILDTKTKATVNKVTTEEAATAARHLGALASSNDTDKALQTYRRATQLDPSNAVGWSQLGHLQSRVDDLEGAEKSYREAIRLAEESGDKQLLSIANGSLGLVYERRGEFNGAEAMYKKALDINEELGNKEGLASNYSSLGIVYDMREEYSQAEVMHKKALAINKELGNKEGLAGNYGDLSSVYKSRYEPGLAEAMLEKSVALFQQAGVNPRAEKLQERLDDQNM